MTTTTAEPTLEEQVQALKETAARLAAERDVAFQMAGQASKDLDRAQREYKARLEDLDALIDSLRIDADRRNAELRRLDARNRELAVENEDLRQQRDKDQQEAPPVRKCWWSGRIGNQL